MSFGSCDKKKWKGFENGWVFCLLLKFGKSDNFSNFPYFNKPWSSGLFLHVPLFPAHSSVRLSMCTYVNWSIRTSSYTTVWSVSYQGPMTESLSSGCHFGLSVLYLSILLSLKKQEGPGWYKTDWKFSINTVFLGQFLQAQQKTIIDKRNKNCFCNLTLFKSTCHSWHPKLCKYHLGYSHSYIGCKG